MNTSSLLRLGCALGILSSVTTFGATPKKASPIQATLKALPSDKGEFGLDWKAEFSRDLAKEGRAGASENLKLVFESTGLVALKEKENVHNAVNASLGLKGTRWKFAERAGAAPTVLLDPATATLDDLAWLADYKATYVYPKLDAVFESTQSLRHFNAGVGASLAVRTPELHPVLDFIPSMLRYGDSKNRPRALDLSVGYRYLRQNYISTLFPTKSDNIERADLNVEWETGIFSGQRLVLRYNGYYLLSAAPRKYVDFFVARVDLLEFPTLGKGAAVSIKYTAGQLPPLYQTGTSLGGGLSIDF